MMLEMTKTSSGCDSPIHTLLHEFWFENQLICNDFGHGVEAMDE